MLIAPTDGLPSVGVYALNSEPTVRPHALTRIATLVEELGYDSVWVGEHLVLPDPPSPESPFDPRVQLSDPLVVLSFLAAVTHRIRLATGLVVLPLRHPVILAKQLASLDVLSGGRLTFGFGVGYIAAEAAALGVPHIERGSRGVEFLEAMRSLWHDEHPTYHGRHVDFDHIDAHPRPVQADIPVVTGGHTRAAFQRTVACAHGWYGFLVRPAEVAGHLQGLRDVAAKQPRPEHLGALEVTVTPRGRLTRERLVQFHEAGVHRLVLYPPQGLDLAGLEDYLRHHAQFVRPAD